MNRLARAPTLMVAPNGARRNRHDHPNLPITIEETVDAARACFDAGAGALHAHVRDETGAHTLDPGRYRALIAAMAAAVPDMPVQITTEAVGTFTPDEQRQTVLEVNPEGASVAIREMWPGPAADDEARRFYFECAGRGIAIQHIVYSLDDQVRVLGLAAAGDLPGPIQMIYVLGSYASGAVARPGDLDPYLAAQARWDVAVDWAVCAFGQNETACLAHAFRQGGKMRVGFENNLHNPDGETARSNAERVADVVRATKADLP